jgi:virulence factor
MNKVRVCVIGAGMMANKVHYPSLASFDDVEITGICDLNPQRLTETADRYGITNRYGDYRKMLDEQRPDGIYVIMPPQYMYDIVCDCIGRGLNVFTEKPLGLNLHQAETLALLAEEKKVITQVGHQRRSSPILNEVLNRCKAHGDVNHAVIEFYKYDMNPMSSAADHIHDDCSHSIDTLRWICGGEVVKVDSCFKRIGTPDINWVHSTLQFDNGATGIVINSWASGRRVFRVEVHCPGAYADIELENKAFLYENGDYGGKEFDCREVAGSDEFYVYGGFKLKSREFIDSIKTGKSMTSSPFSDVLKTMRVLETMVAQSVLAGV